MNLHQLNFQPLPGLASSHMQTILGSYFPPGEEPPSVMWTVHLHDGDRLVCQVSTPAEWTATDDTVIMIHGMGGCDTSTYMVRISRKLYQKGYRVIRVNLRGGGSGKGLSKRPYNAGSSDDILQIIEFLKKESPQTEIIILGFSLGGNITIKLAGELGEAARNIVKLFISVCAPIDLLRSVKTLEENRNRLYHLYYLSKLCEQAKDWLPKEVNSLYEFDEVVTARLWGYSGAEEYYENCSGVHFLKKIRHDTHLLFAEDDPFVPFPLLDHLELPKHVHVWKTQQGGHMGFLGKATNATSPFWMDYLLMNWIEGDFHTDKANHS